MSAAVESQIAYEEAPMGSGNTSSLSHEQVDGEQPPRFLALAGDVPSSQTSAEPSEISAPFPLWSRRGTRLALLRH